MQDTLSTRHPARLALLLLIGLMICLPSLSALAADKLGKQAREQLGAEITAQVEGMLPYEGALVGGVESLNVRGKLPELYRVEVIPPSSWRTGRVQAKILDLDHPERPAAFVQVTLSIEVPVYRPLHDLSSKQAVAPTDLERVMLPIAQVPHDAVSDPSQLEAKVTRRAISASQVVCASHLDDPVVFTRGQVVQIRVKRGNVELVDTGVALETGKLYGTIRVQSHSTKATITGTVMTDHVAL